MPRIPIPAEKLYLASSSAPDLFLQMDALDTVQYSSTAPESWRIPELRRAEEEERVLYAGKYSAPDYELLLEEGCDLAVENTMILHSPETKEKLEALGLPALIEYSSYEPHPLGRVEWIKLYGLLTGRLPEAEAFFDRQAETFRSVENAAPSGKTVAFFHITPSGAVVVRKQADYVTRMIELAGGESVFTALPGEENALSTVTIQMESFYAQARDADVLIYNSTVAGDVEDIEAVPLPQPAAGRFQGRAGGEGLVHGDEHVSALLRRGGHDRGLRAIVLLDGDGRTLHYLHRTE